MFEKEKTFLPLKFEHVQKSSQNLEILDSESINKSDGPFLSLIPIWQPSKSPKSTTNALIILSRQTQHPSLSFKELCFSIPRECPHTRSSQLGRTSSFFGAPTMAVMYQFLINHVLIDPFGLPSQAKPLCLQPWLKQRWRRAGDPLL